MMNSHSARRWKEYQIERLKTQAAAQDLFDDLTENDFLDLLESPSEPVDLAALKADYEDSGPRRRCAPRYGLAVKVYLVSAHRIFKTVTQNVSLSGMLIKDYVPEDLMRGPIEIMIVNEDKQGKEKYLLFKGHMVGAPLKTNRLMFDDFHLSAKEKLMDLLHELTPLMFTG